MDKIDLLQEIGNWYGNYYCQNGIHYIENGDKVYQYETVDDGLKDWLYTLLEDGTHIWDDAIEFIVIECNVKIEGVRLYKGKKGNRWMATIDVPTKNKKDTIQKSCGTFNNPTDAFFERKKSKMEFQRL